MKTHNKLTTVTFVCTLGCVVVWPASELSHHGSWISGG